MTKCKPEHNGGMKPGRSSRRLDAADVDPVGKGPAKQARNANDNHRQHELQAIDPAAADAGTPSTQRKLEAPAC